MSLWKKHLGKMPSPERCYDTFTGPSHILRHSLLDVKGRFYRPRLYDESKAISAMQIHTARVGLRGKGQRRDDA